MAAYLQGRFVQEFSKRTGQNLHDIKGKRVITFDDTALISSLLAVFVLPHERADDQSYMAELLKCYSAHPLERIVTVLRAMPQSNLSPSEPDVPHCIGDIPRFLRHAVAHMNIRPESADEQFLTHLLVWNVNPRSKKITFVARVHLARLRSLALHVLEQLATSELGDRYEGIDPIAQFDRDHASNAVTAASATRS
jgi:hypothetical protein